MRRRAKTQQRRGIRRAAGAAKICKESIFRSPRPVFHRIAPDQEADTASEDEKRVEGARTQSLFREVNERIEEVTAGRSALGEVVCECADQTCAETIPLTLDEYEAVRRIATHFLVRPGHDVPEIERVVDETDRYVVVEKLDEAGSVATALDPRSRDAAEPT